MALTQEQLKAARERLGVQVSSPVTSNIASELDSAWATTPTQKPSLKERAVGALKGETTFEATQGGAESIPENLAKTVGNIPSSATKIVRGVIAPVNPLDVNSPLNIGSNVVKGVDAVKDIFKERGIKEGIKDIAGGVADTATKIFKKPGEFIVDQAMKFAEKPGEYTANATEKIAKMGIEDPLFIPSLIYGGPKATGSKADVISTVTKPITRGADTSVSNITKEVTSAVQDLTAKTEKQIESSILTKFEKGVKPTITGKITSPKVSGYRDDVVEAVKTIKENQPNLSFVDDVGESINGQTPKNLQQFSEAIEQTKKNVFTKYDALAKEAGEAGVKVKMAPIADELDVVINDKALNLANPKAVRYAKEMKDRFNQAGELDAVTAQNVIQHYNKSLEAFYRNPSYDNASQAAIDSLLVNKMRKSLDDGVTEITGEGYQALKNQYGALKTIEKDVIKASLRDARKNVKGLIDFSDILSGGQVVSGLVSLNPGLIASGVTQKAITQFYKYLNNPNRAIEKMFKSLDQKGTPIPNKQGGFISADFASGKKLSQSTIKKIPSDLRDEAVSAYDNLRDLNDGNLNINMQEDINTFMKKVESGSVTPDDLMEAERIQRYLRNEPVSLKVKSSKFVQDAKTGRMKGSSK